MDMRMRQGGWCDGDDGWCPGGGGDGGDGVWVRWVGGWRRAVRCRVMVVRVVVTATTNDDGGRDGWGDGVDGAVMDDAMTDDDDDGR